MEINLSKNDFDSIRRLLHRDIATSKKFLENHQDDEISYCDVLKNRIEELEPILNKINEQVENLKVKVFIK